MSQSEVTRAIEENELKVLTGRVLITISNNDTFAKLYNDGVFGITNVVPNLRILAKINH